MIDFQNSDMENVDYYSRIKQAFIYIEYNYCVKKRFKYCQSIS